MEREELRGIKRVVIKVGTSTIAHESGLINIYRMEHLARMLSDIKNRGYEVVLVSSGAIGVGAQRMHLSERPRDIQGKQAAAAVGQVVLMNMYQKFFHEYNYQVAQILVTKQVETDKLMKYHAKNTFGELLRNHIIPIVNENDTISTDEIIFGDNDTLSAVVAGLVDADLLILLSDIDGLYTDDPKLNPDAELMDKVLKIDDQIESIAKDSSTKLGTGGMITKIKAAKYATKRGIHVVLANGSSNEAIEKILNGDKVGTLFVGGEKR
ncbi:glutamate 5-kinase [Proteiniclasticum sp.]|uniref:glutamate 5-kinase n=1 Tax=Proteiniclasticum sp. TaxID=2053595 RepID=UPI0028984A00|nr:glutamate 5-kinase [Proteiniclasticum sp.]